jgi:glycosyltransferase involved in cell wall biosynthesis
VTDSSSVEREPDADAVADVDVLIIAMNEAVNLPHSLAALTGWTRSIHVVDSGSTDETYAVCRRYGVEPVHHDWPGFARQKNWAIENLPLSAAWTLIVDADEVVLPELRDELIELTRRPPETVGASAFQVNRYFLFLGRRIRRCGYYPSWNIRLFKRGAARYEDREVHEAMIVDGAVGYLRGHLEHYDRRGVSHWNAKHNRYAELEAAELFRLIRGEDSGLKPGRLLGDAVSRRRWFKRHAYPRIPARWLARFVYAYVVKLGVLDGVTGFRFCLFLASYELMIGLNLAEMKQSARAETHRGSAGRRVGAPPVDARPALRTHRAAGRANAYGTSSRKKPRINADERR